MEDNRHNQFLKVLYGNVKENEPLDVEGTPVEKPAPMQIPAQYKTPEMSASSEVPEVRPEPTQIPSSIAIGGIPLLIGALTGNLGIGAKVGGEQVMNQVERDYQKEKVLFDANKKSERLGKSKLLRVLDEDGIERYIPEDQAVNRPTAGFVNTIGQRIDYNERKLIDQEKFAKAKEIRTGKTGDTYKGLALNEGIKKEAESLDKQFQSFAKDDITALKQVNSIKQLLAEGSKESNDAALNMARYQLARMVEKGPMTERDAGIALNQMSMINDLKEKAMLEKTGKYSPKVQSNIDRVVGIMAKHNQKIVNDAARKMVDARSDDPLKKRYYMDRISGRMPTIESLEPLKFIITNGEETFEMSYKDYKKHKRQLDVEGFRIKD